MTRNFDSHNPLAWGSNHDFFFFVTLLISL